MSQPSLSLAGKTAIVTGASHGIGRAIALTLAGAGADVAICSRGFEDLEVVAKEIRGMKRRALAVSADTSRKADVDNLVKQAVAAFGGIDILVNNAGIVPIAPILEMTEETWDQVMDVDVKGYFLCAQAVARKMIEQKRKGAIVQVASHFGFRAGPPMGGYSVAKAGVVMLTKVLARELGPYGIRANGIAPGFTKTEGTSARIKDPNFIKEREAAVPLRRVAEPEDMVGAVLFLASDASSYITGDTIIVDGGGLT